MFNTLFLVLLGVFVVFESYKIAVKNNSTIMTHQTALSGNNFLFLYLSLIFWIMSKFFSDQHPQQFILAFFLIFILIFNIFNNIISKTTVPLMFIMSLTSYIVFCDTTLVSIVFGAELLSVASFFIVFFNTKSISKLLNTGIFYFLINNIITFLFGLITVIFLLNTYGTLNYNVLQFYFFNTNKSSCAFLLFIYFLFKLGQNFVIFFKFKFYKFAKFTHLVYYIIIYVIFIWPLILFLMSTINALTLNMYVVIFLILATGTIFQSIFFYNSLTDFMVFSTFIFMWYQILFTIIYV